MNMAKLPPAPWKVEIDAEGGHYIPHHGRFPMLLPECGVEGDLTALHFAALARNAFDVMVRRSWWVVPKATFPRGGWFVRLASARDYTIEEQEFPDPFTALVEAEKWYVENVESKK